MLLQDWFADNYTSIAPLLSIKHAAYLDYNARPSSATKAKLNRAKAVQKIARFCANKYWCELSVSIQAAAASGNTRVMYEGIKRAIGPQIKKFAPLKTLNGSVITDREQQMSRWIEHFMSLYANEIPISASALVGIDRLPEMSELDIEPTILELKDAIKHMAPRKSPGNDGLPLEILRIPCLLDYLHSLLLSCREEGTVPQDMRDEHYPI